MQQVKSAVLRKMDMVTTSRAYTSSFVHFKSSHKRVLHLLWIDYLLAALWIHHTYSCLTSDYPANAFTALEIVTEELCGSGV